MPAANQGFPRQLRQAIQRGEHLRRRAFEQTAAAQAEQGIAAQQQAGSGVGHMAEGVARDRDHLEAHGRRRQFDPIAVAYPASGLADAFIDGRINRHVVACAQGRHTADVIVVVMGQQNRAQLQTMRRQRLLDDLGITRIDGDGVAIVVVQQPDVVVGQRR